MRILHIVHEMNRGGIENFIMNLYRALDKEKIQLDFVYHIDNKCAFDNEIIKFGGKIFHCPDYKIINHFSYIKWWNDFFKEHKEYKIIHSHLDSCANIHLRIAKKFNLITIAHSHSSSDGIGIKAYIKTFLKINFNSCCDYKFACSELAAKWLYGKAELDNGNCKIIKNGIDSSKFRYNKEIRNKIRQQLSVSNEDILLGHVGRIDKNKNQGFIIDILSELLNMNVNAKLILIGDGIEKSNYQIKASNLNISENIMFLGTKENIYDYLQAMDIFVFPSIYEGFPLTLIEAQASGIHCLISDNISNEVKITNCIDFQSLNNNAAIWASEIRELINLPRENTTDIIVSKGYDIKTTAVFLTDFYLNLLS